MGGGLNASDDGFARCGGGPPKGVIEFEFWSSGVIVCMLASFGILGNFLSFVSIFCKKKVSLFNKLLLALALVDSVFLLTGGTFMTHRAFKISSQLYLSLTPLFIYPGAAVTMTGSTYTCVAISLERYLGICHRTLESTRKLLYYLIGIGIVTLTIEFPRFFELESFKNPDGTYSLRYASFRWSQTFVTFYATWFRLFFTALIPCFLLGIFNTKIYLFYKRNSFKNSSIIGRSSGLKLHQERTLSMTLLCITCTLFLCHVPRLVLNINEFVHLNDVVYCSEKRQHWNAQGWTHYLMQISNPFLILNSSINFVFYCMVGKSFRDNLKKRLFKIVYCLRSQQPTTNEARSYIIPKGKEGEEEEVETKFTENYLNSPVLTYSTSPSTKTGPIVFMMMMIVRKDSRRSGPRSTPIQTRSRRRSIALPDKRIENEDGIEISSDSSADITQMKEGLPPEPVKF